MGKKKGKNKFSLPKIDLKELADEKKRNFQQRLEFIDWYVNWLKRMPNKKWSKDQKAVVEQF